MATILSPQYYTLIWRVSWINAVSCMYAVYMNHVDLAFAPGGILITSLLYWYKPDYSWRRYVDMTYVHFALIYHLCRAWNAEFAIPYYAMKAISLAMYQIGVYYYRQGDHERSTQYHCLLHVIANAANIVLYTGHIDPLLWGTYTNGLKQTRMIH